MNRLPSINLNYTVHGRRARCQMNNLTRYAYPTYRVKANETHFAFHILDQRWPCMRFSACQHHDVTFLAPPIVKLRADDDGVVVACGDDDDARECFFCQPVVWLLSYFGIFPQHENATSTTNPTSYVNGSWYAMTGQ